MKRKTPKASISQRPAHTPKNGPQIIAVGGGKGGVGKTVVASSLSVGLALQRQRVVLIDADLSGANLHTVFGVSKPKSTFFEFIRDPETRIEDVAYAHPQIENLRIVFGAPGSLGVSNLRYAGRMKILQQLKKLDADFVVLDLGAGSSHAVLDFFNEADHGIVLMNPEPLSILESYNFIKQALFRKLLCAFRETPAVLKRIRDYADAETQKTFTTVSQLRKEVARANPKTEQLIQDITGGFRPLTLMNKTVKPEDEEEGYSVEIAAHELLSLVTGHLGAIHLDEAVQRSVAAGVPFILHDPKSRASIELNQIVVDKILARGTLKALVEKFRLSRRSPHSEMPEQSTLCSIRCFFWEECEYKEGGLPCRLHHLCSIGNLTGG
jgi:flagellar biosynthesis protein FlhG